MFFFSSSPLFLSLFGLVRLKWSEGMTSCEVIDLLHCGYCNQLDQLEESEPAGMNKQTWLQFISGAVSPPKHTSTHKGCNFPNTLVLVTLCLCATGAVVMSNSVRLFNRIRLVP